MRIIHTGDIHLGSAFKNLPPDKAAVRRSEILDGFRRLCAFAKEQGVCAVLIAGDLFDERKVPRSLQQEAANIFALAKPVCFFYVSGNHDGTFAIENLPDNVYTFSCGQGWQSYDLPENITVTGADSAYFSSALFHSLALRGERYNILLLHGEISRMETGGADCIPLARLQNRGVDYLALGHIHIPNRTLERLDGRGVYRYCGCLEGRGFDECGERGFFLLEIQNGRLVGEQFYTLAKRKIVECGADISACETYYDVERAVVSALSAVRADDVVKVALVGRHKLGLRKDIPLLTARLSQSYFYAKVVDNSRVAIDFNAFSSDLSERGEFVREVGRYELNDEERAEILDVGLKALAGEEIDL